MKYTHPHQKAPASPATRASRRVQPAWIIGTAASLLAASIGVRAFAGSEVTGQSAQAAAPASGTLQQEEAKFAAIGEATTEKICIICHPWDNITQKRRTLQQWDEVIINMGQRGAPGTPDQFTIVKKFLARYYGLVNVNTATAEELSTVLGLLEKEAEAIVAHRKAHGKFADLASLMKVPGIDQKKLAEQPDALVFE